MHNKIVFLHVPKAGGTTLIRWLEMMLPSSRVRPTERHAEFLRDYSECQTAAGDDRGGGEHVVSLKYREMGREARAYWDVIHDHCPAIVAPPGVAYQIVVLRDPVERVLSIVRDWRRLNDEDIARAPAEERDIRAAARHCELNKFVEMMMQRRDLMQLINGQTAILCEAARYAMPRQALSRAAPEPRELASLALDRLFQCVGITSQLSTVANCISRDLGLPPVSVLDRHNAGSPLGDQESLSASVRDMVIGLNQDDLFLLEIVKQRLEKHAAQPFDERTFESGSACSLTAQLMPRQLHNELYFSVDDRIVGFGFHGRDASGTPGVNVWSGPGERSVLYIPVPSHEHIQIFLDIGGYMENLEVGIMPPRLRILVDGVRSRFYAITYPNVRERLVIPVCTRRSYVKVEIVVERSCTAAEIGLPSDDPRRRSVALRGYGYSLIPILPLSTTSWDLFLGQESDGREP